MWELDHKEGWSEVKWKSLRCVQLFATPWTWNFLGQNTGVGSLSLLQGVFPTQGSNPSLPHCRQILYQLSQKGSPRILEWVAYPFSSRSPWPRNWTGVSFIAGGFFTNWAIREAPLFTKAFQNQFIIWFSSVQSFSHVRLCDPMDCSMPGLPVHHQLASIYDIRLSLSDLLHSE